MTIKISIKYKLLIFIYLLFFIQIFASFLYVWIETDRSLKKIEADWIQNTWASAEKLQEEHNNLLLRSVVDYSTWDDMYDVASSKDQAWFARNITDWVPNNFGVNWILAVDSKNNLIGQYNSPEEYSSDFNQIAFIQKALAGESFSGLLLTSQELYQVACAPILRSDGSGPINGILLYGQIVSANSLLKIKNIFQSDITYILADNRLISTTEQSTAKKNTLINQATQIKDNLKSEKIITYIEDDLIHLYSPLLEIESKPIGTLILTLKLNDLLQIRRQLIQIFIIVIVTSVLLVLLTVPLFIKSFTNPLRKLISAMDLTEDGLPAKVTITTGDELQQLAGNYNQMIDKLNNSRKETNIKIDELEKFNKLAVDREIKMMELKKEINKLKNNRPE